MPIRLTHTIATFGAERFGMPALNAAVSVVRNDSDTVAPDYP